MSQVKVKLKEVSHPVPRICSTASSCPLSRICSPAPYLLSYTAKVCACSRRGLCTRQGAPCTRQVAYTRQGVPCTLQAACIQRVACTSRLQELHNDRQLTKSQARVFVVSNAISQQPNRSAMQCKARTSIIQHCGLACLFVWRIDFAMYSMVAGLHMTGDRTTAMHNITYLLLCRLRINHDFILSNAYSS